jgi:hypothetical protein
MHRFVEQLEGRRGAAKFTCGRDPVRELVFDDRAELLDVQPGSAYSEMRRRNPLGGPEPSDGLEPSTPSLP